MTEPPTYQDLPSQSSYQDLPGQSDASKDLSIALLHSTATFLEGSADGMGTTECHDALVVEAHPGNGRAPNEDMRREDIL